MDYYQFDNVRKKWLNGSTPFSSGLEETIHPSPSSEIQICFQILLLLLLLCSEFLICNRINLVLWKWLNMETAQHGNTSKKETYKTNFMSSFLNLQLK